MTTPVQTISSREERHALYFGSTGAQLFGCYHPPFGSEVRGCAVVLCYPFGQEYIRAHRSFGQLARRLAARGFPVFRFDYFGAGDSAGDAREASMARWVADTNAAIDEALRLSGRSRVALLGLRLGGAVAAGAAGSRSDVDALVLWDPVIRGAAHAAELEAMQSDLLRLGYLTPPKPYRASGRPEEVFGFPVPETLWREIEGTDLLALDRAPAPRVLVVESGEPAGLAALQERLGALGAETTHQQLAEPKVWLAEPLKGIVPHRLLESVVSWLAEEPA